jgi:hypothetical protein
VPWLNCSSASIPAVNRRRLRREHEARQAEGSRADHGRENHGDGRGDSLDGLDPVDHVQSRR